MTKLIEAPILTTYLNINFYLQDLYHYRKAKDPYFSYEVWAKELKVKSRSYLRLVVIGKRSLSEEAAVLICNSMEFSEKEKEYFFNLRLYSQSRSHEQKKIHGRKLMQIIKRELSQHEVEPYYEFLSTPLLPKLQTLLSFEDIDRTSISLGRLLDKPVVEVEAGLKVLEKIEMAEVVEGPMVEWKAKNKSFKVSDKYGDLAAEIYHTDALESAIKAQKLSKELRRFRSLLVPMDANNFQEFLGDIQLFVEQTLAKYDSSSLRNKRLYQININLFPVSDCSEPVC